MSMPGYRPLPPLWRALPMGLALLVAACALHKPIPPVTDQGLTAPVPPAVAPGYYVVQPGDTLYAISLKFERDFRELARINHLPDDDHIMAGQKLLINPKPMPRPRSRSDKARTVAPLAHHAEPGPVPLAASGFQVVPLPASPEFPDATSPLPGKHRPVHHAAAQASGIVAAAAASAPLQVVPLPEPDDGDDAPALLPPSLSAAAVALVPVGAGRHGRRVVAAEADHAAASGGSAAIEGEGGATRSHGHATVATSVSQKPPPVGGQTRPASGSPSLDVGFSWSWPIKGRIIGHFGAGGLGNKGLDIAGRRGDAVLAAADGVVVYVGAGLTGYGKLIIIRHTNNFLSAYAHNDKFYVNEGDSVKVGDKIADVGSSGADRGELHFEIRRQGKPVDPLLYLPPQDGTE